MFATLFMKSGNGENNYIDGDKSVADHLNSHHHTCDRTPYVWGGSSLIPVILANGCIYHPTDESLWRKGVWEFFD